MKKSNTKCCY